MDYRYTAVGATIANSFSDAVLDYTVNKFNYHKVLLYTSGIAFVLQFLYGLNVGIMFSFDAIPYLLVHAMFVLLGYICFVKSLEYLPLGLVGLIESSNLFLTLLIDSWVGYIKVTAYFVFMFMVFVFSIALFCQDCLKHDTSDLKKIKREGFIWSLASVIFYVTAPYLIKISDGLGANEIAINLTYYVVALPYFAYKVWMNKTQNSGQSGQWWNSFLFLGLVIGVLESVYYVLETFSFINDAPTIVMIIAQMRIFLVFLLSVFFKMDKFSKQKSLALVLGIASVVGVYYS